MENNELINIWNALSDNQLIEKELAKENIARIIQKKHGKIIGRIRKKVIFDFSLYLVAIIGVSIAWTIANINAPKPFELIHIIGVLSVEAYLGYMLLKAYTKLRELHNADYNLSIKSSIENLKNKYLKLLNKERIAAHIFSYLLILVTAVQYISYLGGLQQIEQSKLLIIGSLIIIMPLLLKIEYKIRYANSIKKLNNNIAELEE